MERVDSLFFFQILVELVGMQFIHLFFQMIWTLPVSLESAGVSHSACHIEDDEICGVGHWSGSWGNII